MRSVTENNDAVNHVDGGEAGEQQDRTFTQAEVDQMIRSRAERLAKQLYPDYEDLKSRAAGAKTLEDRVGSLESELTSTRTEAARIRVAAKFGISTEKGSKGEPSDADLLLTGADEAAMTAQAERLSARSADQKKHGNVAPKEGETKTSGSGDKDLREFARGLFARAD